MACVLFSVALAIAAVLAVPSQALGVTSSAVSGADRYKTAIEVSERAYPTGANTVIVANGMAWADALGGSALAGAVDGPILLSQRDTVPWPVRAELRRLDPSRVYLLGGTASLSPAVAVQIVDSLDPAVEVVRLAGRDRNAVATRVASEAVDVVGGPIGTAFVTTGRGLRAVAHLPHGTHARPRAGHRGDEACRRDARGHRRRTLIGSVYD
jgi:putative cell wall-binding protein